MPGGAVFAPDDAITTQEAAVMLDNALDTTSAAASTAISEAASAWAAEACANLSACGVLTDGEAFQTPLTRADAAEMLIRALDVLEARK